MGIANKLLSSVSGLYTSLNPITLSGVNDVIVVRQADGSLRSSPFHVRFSRLSFPNNRPRAVHLIVNGNDTGIQMGITNQGDLFFTHYGGDVSPYDSKQAVGLFTTDSIEAILSERLRCTAQHFGDSPTSGVSPPSTAPTATASAPPTSPPAATIALRHSPSPKPYPRGYYSVSFPSAQLGIQDDLVLLAAGGHQPAAEVNDEHSRAMHSLTPSRMNASNFERARVENISLRLFAMHTLPGSHEQLYAALASRFSRINNMLTAPDHYAALLDKAGVLASVLDCIIRGRRGSSLQFSACGNCKPESPLEAVFRTYLVSEISAPENIIVRLEAVTSLRFNVRFYLTFSVFSRLFFQVRAACDAAATKETTAQQTAGATLPARRPRYAECLAATVLFLEREHNTALGWNLFGKRTPLKRDVGFSLKPCAADLAAMGLRPGKNAIVFKISGMNCQLEGDAYLWDYTDRVIISDIDGTITKSDIRGHLYGLVGRDWTHTGIAGLYSRIARNGYRLLYLTARPLGQSAYTRAYLKAISQDSCTLPDGPIISSPGGVLEAFYREVIVKKSEVFKTACLSEIRELFGGYNPFMAGFGNRVGDVFTYKSLEIPNNRIYTINPDGQLTAEYTQALVGTYHTMNDFIDSIFPPLFKEEGASDDKVYSDFGWWRQH